MPINLKNYHHIVVLTGAGISVASGIRPFRGPGGLWEDIDPMIYATHEALLETPLMVWKLFGVLRTQLKTHGPNPAHNYLADIEKQLSNEHQFTLITQNIDGLHLAAGSINVVEMHGAIQRTRCSNEFCQLKPFEDDDPHTEVLPTCPICHAPLRPDIVLFNEFLSEDVEKRCNTALLDVDLFIAIGTSGVVYPAASFVHSAYRKHARTILINLEPMDPPNPYFMEETIGKAEECLPELITV